MKFTHQELALLTDEELLAQAYAVVDNRLLDPAEAIKVLMQEVAKRIERHTEDVDQRYWQLKSSLLERIHQRYGEDSNANRLNKSQQEFLARLEQQVSALKFLDQDLKTATTRRRKMAIARQMRANIRIFNKLEKSSDDLMKNQHAAVDQLDKEVNALDPIWTEIKTIHRQVPWFLWRLSGHEFQFKCMQWLFLCVGVAVALSVDRISSGYAEPLVLKFDRHSYHEVTVVFVFLLQVVLLDAPLSKLKKKLASKSYGSLLAKAKTLMHDAKQLDTSLGNAEASIERLRSDGLL